MCKVGGQSCHRMERRGNLSVTGNRSDPLPQRRRNNWSIPKGGQNTLTKQNPRHNKRNTRAAVWNFLALLVKCHPYYLPRSLIVFLLTAHTQKSYCMLFNSRAISGLLAPEGDPEAKRILTRSFAVPTMEEPPNAGENDGSSEWGLVKTQHHRSRRELPSGGFST